MYAQIVKFCDEDMETAPALDEIDIRIIFIPLYREVDLVFSIEGVLNVEVDLVKASECLK